ARGVVRTRRAVLLHAHVAAAHADDAVVLDQWCGGRKTRKYVHAERFGALPEALAETAEGNDEIAVVVLLWWRGQADAPGLGQQQEFILPSRDADGRPVFPPFGPE